MNTMETCYLLVKGNLDKFQPDRSAMLVLAGSVEQQQDGGDTTIGQGASVQTYFVNETLRERMALYYAAIEVIMTHMDEMIDSLPDGAREQTRAEAQRYLRRVIDPELMEEAG